MVNLESVFKNTKQSEMKNTYNVLVAQIINQNMKSSSESISIKTENHA